MYGVEKAEEQGFSPSSLVSTPVLLSAIGAFELVAASNAGAATVFFGLAALAAFWPKTSADAVVGNNHKPDYGF
ncbi:MAG: hypothetical protein AB1626_00080 [Candidatus Micrarchaeota archaeon]